MFLKHEKISSVKQFLKHEKVTPTWIKFHKCETLSKSSLNMEELPTCIIIFSNKEKFLKFGKMRSHFYNFV